MISELIKFVDIIDRPTDNRQLIIDLKTDKTQADSFFGELMEVYNLRVNCTDKKILMESRHEIVTNLINPTTKEIMVSSV